MSEKSKYFQLLSMVCDKLPTSAVDALVKKEYPLGATSLSQVRIGRTINLPALIELIKVGLPDFAIPAELLPEAVPQPLFQ
jgi:hypothetical protein